MTKEECKTEIRREHREDDEYGDRDSSSVHTLVSRCFANDRRSCRPYSPAHQSYQTSYASSDHLATSDSQSISYRTTSWRGMLYWRK